MPRALRALAIAAAIAVVARAGAAGAGDWEIEVHGGLLWTLTPSGGQATTLPPAEPFPTVVPGVSSRRVTSWYFGDGGMLLRQSRTPSGNSGSYNVNLQTGDAPINITLGVFLPS